MPYILISTTIRLETGPTVVGDENSNKEIMNYLGAKLHFGSRNIILFLCFFVDNHKWLMFYKHSLFFSLYQICL